MQKTQQPASSREGVSLGQQPSVARVLWSALCLIGLSGCGSCLEDKKVPEGEEKQPVRSITRQTDGGKHRIVVGEGVSLSDTLKRLDASSRNASGQHDGGT